VRQSARNDFRGSDRAATSYDRDRLGRRSANVESYGGWCLAHCAQGCTGAREGDGSVVIEAGCELQRVAGGLTGGDGGGERVRRTTD
jgi:hypothetical protein